MAVRNVRAPMAAPFVPVGRTIEHAGSCLLRNTVGSGMIRFVWNICLTASPVDLVRKGLEMHDLDGAHADEES